MNTRFCSNSDQTCHLSKLNLESLLQIIKTWKMPGWMHVIMKSGLIDLWLIRLRSFWMFENQMQISSEKEKKVHAFRNDLNFSEDWLEISWRRWAENPEKSANPKFRNLGWKNEWPVKEDMRLVFQTLLSSKHLLLSESSITSAEQVKIMKSVFPFD